MWYRVMKGSFVGGRAFGVVVPFVWWHGGHLVHLWVIVIAGSRAVDGVQWCWWGVVVVGSWCVVVGCWWGVVASHWCVVVAGPRGRSWWSSCVWCRCCGSVEAPSGTCNRCHFVLLC